MGIPCRVLEVLWSSPPLVIERMGDLCRVGVQLDDRVHALPGLVEQLANVLRGNRLYRKALDP